MDIADTVQSVVTPTLIPLLVALLVLLFSTIALFFILRQKDAAVEVKPKKPEFRTYTREEVEQHNKPDDCWLILKLKTNDDLRVYDVTSYVEEHPGGEAIYRNAGGDATAGFYGLHHPPRAHEMIDIFCIGTLAD